MTEQNQREPGPHGRPFPLSGESHTIKFSDRTETDQGRTDQTLSSVHKDLLAGMGGIPYTVKGKHSYVLLRPLGSGHFGSVYMAICESDSSSDADCPPHTVALKFVAPMPGENPFKLLKRELSSMLALRHDRIPRVYDWHLEPPQPFVVIEYFPHGSLQERILVNGPLNEEEAWRLLRDLLAALTEAHRASILHLDIKPGNVLLDGKGGYVLADFGISQGHLVARGMVDTGLGAPLYQSPEQKRSDHDAFDARTDLWGVGITTWAAISGIPYKQIQQHRTACALGTCGMPRLSEIAASCSAELDNLVMSLLMLDQDKRPASAAEVLASVQNKVSGNLESELHPEIPGRPASHAEFLSLVDSLMDPLWAAICSADTFAPSYLKIEDGEVLCREGERSYYAYVILRGKVRVEKDGHLVSLQDREGEFVGELTTLTGRTRTATLRAEGPVWVRMFNATELERFVIQHPAVGIRLVKTLADRLCLVLGG